MQKHANIDRVIFCQEGFHNWRKEYYKLYKANRAEGREASDIDFDAFFAMNNEFMSDFAAMAKNFQFLQVPECEADDLIAVITKHYKNTNIICQSSDKDFYQLYKYKNYKQWDGVKRKFIEVANPETYLIEKIILGDSGDNVPRISGLKYRQGPKFIERNVLPDIDKWLDETNSREEWERNYTLISFDAIPERLSSEIIRQVDNWQKGEFAKNQLYNFMIKHRIFGQIDFIGDYANAFSKY